MCYFESNGPEGGLKNSLATEFSIPEGAEKPWHRLSTGTGSGADAAKVLAVLRREWSVNSSDARALRLWLLEQGVRLEGLRDEEISQAQRGFERYQVAKRRNTEDLIRGVLSGSSLSYFLLGLRTCPTELKEFVFRKALSGSSGEKLVLVLVFLSLESQDTIQSCVIDAPESQVLDNFCQYLHWGAVRRPSADPAMSKSTLGSEDTLEQLFEFISLPPAEINARLHMVPPGQLSELTSQAAHLHQMVPREGYGEFVRFKLASFVCIADPDNAIGDDVINHLDSIVDRNNTELLRFLGPRRAGELFSRLVSGAPRHEDDLASTVLDSICTNYPALLGELPESQLTQLSRAGNPISALSARAALLLSGRSTEDDFAKFLQRKLNSDKKGLTVLWVARNPRFLEYVSLDKVPVQGWNSALQNLAGSDPLALTRLIDSAFANPAEGMDRRWDHAFKALARIPLEGQALFARLALRLIKQSPHSAVSVLSREPAASLLWRSVWEVSEKSNDAGSWDIVFSALSNRISDASFAQLLIQSGTRKPFSEWLQSVLFPRLLERGVVSTRFLGEISDLDLQVSLVGRLAAQTVQTVRHLQAIAQNWPSVRASAKERVAKRASAGLRVASRFAERDPVLAKSLADISRILSEWLDEDVPTLDPVLESVSTLRLPDPRDPSREVLSEFFSRLPSLPHEATFFFGVNPWAVEVYLAAPERSWPSPSSLLEQIAKSSAHFAAMRTRSDDLQNDIDRTAKTELAIRWRSTFAEIEEMIGGYFAFRRMLATIGLGEVDAELGKVVGSEELSSEKHKVVRDPTQRGRSRLFGMGLKVGERVVGSATVMKSGEDDDRD